MIEYRNLTPKLTKAARALLGWSQATLAKKAGLGSSTVKRLEASDGAMMKAGKVTKVALYNALSSAGIEFQNGGEPGVRLRSRPQPPAVIDSEGGGDDA